MAQDAPARGPNAPGPADTQAKTDASLAFAFDWSPPCRIPVLETVTRKGRTARLAYYVALRRGQDQNLEVGLEDFAFQEFDGQPISPALHEQLKPALDLTSTLPVLKVSASGKYLGCEGMDAMVERVTRLRPMTEERAAQIRKVFASPQVAAALQASMGTYWATWVESWIGWALAPGTSTTKKEQQLFGAEEAPAVVRQEFLELRGGYATLQRTTEFSGDSAVRAIASLVGNVAEEVGMPGMPANTLKDARIQVTLYTETRPASLRPRRTRFDKSYEVVLTDGTKAAGRELRDVSWNWDRAEGCKRPQ